MLKLLSLTVVVLLLSILGCRARSGPNPERATARVAPVFVHGEGFGTTGGIAGLAVGFLKEKDGRRIIEEELAKVGLSFQADGLTLKKAELPFSGFGPSASDTVRTRPGTLVLDGFDAAHNVAYEYVSSDDFSEWTKDPHAEVIYDAMSPFYTRQSAERLREGILKAKPEATVAVFYDPVLTPEQPGNGHRPGWKELDSLALINSGSELRRQAQDFIEWMKTHGQP